LLCRLLNNRVAEGEVQGGRSDTHAAKTLFDGDTESLDLRAL
jgi:hypothetical protein